MAQVLSALGLVSISVAGDKRLNKQDSWLEEKILELQKTQAALEKAPAFAVVGIAKKAGVIVSEVVSELARRELLRK